MPGSGQNVALLVDKLRSLSDQFDQQLAATKTEHDIHQVKAAYLGKKGHLSSILKALGTLSVDDRPLIGQEANRQKQHFEAACRQALKDVKQKSQQKKLSEERLDLTLPGVSYPLGSLHPITQVLQQVEELFRQLGFEIQEGPEIETDYNNFEALNIPPDHPARDMQDTFYLDETRYGKAGRGALLLRTHTSPVQIRVMSAEKPPAPVQMIAPGPVYRRDSDISHTPVFHQVEGLLVDHDVTFSQLKGTIEIFIHEFFGPKIAVRFRPSYFPFTEPSAEVDISCVMCPKQRKSGAGIGCRVCQQTGWLEVMGCGMVHPEVFRAVEYDPKEWQGFAFGMGIERLAMLKYRINDIRLFYENDLRFLEQFR